jgi:hypothetical protein
VLSKGKRNKKEGKAGDGWVIPTGYTVLRLKGRRNKKEGEAGRVGTEIRKWKGETMGFIGLAEVRSLQRMTSE